MHGFEGPSSSGILESRREIARPIDRALKHTGGIVEIPIRRGRGKSSDGDSLKHGLVEGREQYVWKRCERNLHSRSWDGDFGTMTVNRLRSLNHPLIYSDAMI